MGIEFHAVIHPEFYNVLMVSQRPSIFIIDAADLSLLHICQVLDCLIHPSHFISSLVIFHVHTGSEVLLNQDVIELIVMLTIWAVPSPFCGIL